jgi:Ser/Thr protein kinase RdoA (MazF antagonist)
MLGPMIARGNTADVFDMGGGKVVKLFHAGYPKNSVHYEFENANMIKGLDLPLVKCHEIVTISERYGIVYDRIDGISLQDILLKTQNVEKYATILGQLHRRVLAQRLPAAIDFHSILAMNIEHTDQLDGQRKAKLYEIHDSLPRDDHFCHGDFHFGNILAARQELYIIDYMNVCKGHEYGDIARSVYLIEMTPVPEETPDKETFLYLKRRATDFYLKEMGVSREALLPWLKVIAAARLSELRNEQAEERRRVLNFLAMQGI